ncbi:THAP-type domain-containing protein [Aphis craccivora]|uniref:THAP-type domain-containing protein n=1 Tax=Aphis craccivora TaxID=307492 RepID=A0A6G0VZA0_APHCR|nr:THAP-type domain-containing protein [Aphis craccivora]
MKKCLEKHNCDTCIEYHILLMDILLSKIRTHLSITFPPLPMRMTSGLLKIHFCNVPYVYLCEYFEKSYLINYFTHFRIFTGINILNKAKEDIEKYKNSLLTRPQVMWPIIGDISRIN